MHFTLHLCATADGFIAREPSQPPSHWASPEEQTWFLEQVARADWSVMGRLTHEVALRPDRRRIIFSAGAPQAGEWRLPTQLWIDPDGVTPAALAARVAPVHPLCHGLILGGTRVHDWFHAHNAIDRIEMTVEPLTFGGGVPIFSDQRGIRPPEAVVLDHGYMLEATEAINDRGTERISFTRARPRPGPVAASSGSA